MAPKKAKKSADNINSKLSLVMKSGKGEIIVGYMANPQIRERTHTNVSAP